MGDIVLIHNILNGYSIIIHYLYRYEQLSESLGNLGHKNQILFIINVNYKAIRPKI